MNRLIVIILIVGVGWYAKQYYQQNNNQHILETIEYSHSSSSRKNREFIQTSNSFRCDGRTHCSQMNSCEEATYFLKNCPNTKMDGNGDGIIL